MFLSATHDESGAPATLGLNGARDTISATNDYYLAYFINQSAKAIEDAIRGGVRRVHVVSYQSPEGILGEVFTNEGTGTLIVADVNALTPAEQQSTP